MYEHFIRSAILLNNTFAANTVVNVIEHFVVCFDLHSVANFPSLLLLHELPFNGCMITIVKVRCISLIVFIILVLPIPYDLELVMHEDGLIELESLKNLDQFYVLNLLVLQMLGPNFHQLSKWILFIILIPRCLILSFDEWALKFLVERFYNLIFLLFKLFINIWDRI